ncbi:sentrin-specific protease [Nesidiocoris tenuis]|uniref:Sentrin-specific protease n=1 Tax=Nesidiocoris tenuis TaxID=355587 RepID=A0ABN7A7H6_9HEMI|nr:sentrin-specific protease [Nesidiocoris tenuis]
MTPKRESVLSFHDSLLHQSDVDLLDGPYWLNDSIIGFYVEYLEKEVFADLNICFVRPEVTQCLKLSPQAELPLFLDPLNFKTSELAVMPLNDCDNPTQVGGSHWSLLVYCKNADCFYHLDSSQGSNSSQARDLAAKLSHYLRLKSDGTIHAPNSPPEYVSLSSLQQNNSYDCGVFVLCNMDNVIKHFLRTGSLENLDYVRSQDVNRKRSDLKTLIMSLTEDAT